MPITELHKIENNYQFTTSLEMVVVGDGKVWAGMECKVRLECFRVTYWNHVPSHTATIDDDHFVTMNIDKHHRYYHGKSILMKHVLFFKIRLEKTLFKQTNSSPCKHGQLEGNLSPLLGA